MECPDDETTYLRLFILAVCFVIIIAVFVYQAMQTALKPTDLKSVYMKILMNYL